MRFSSRLAPLIWGLAISLSSVPSWAQSSDGLLVAQADSTASYAPSAAPLQLFVRFGPLSMAQTSTQKTATPGESYPEDASFSQTLFNGPIGLTSAIGGTWSLNDTMAAGLTTKVRWSTYKLKIDEKILSDTAANIMVLGTFHYKIGAALFAEAGAGYHKLDGVFFRYTDGKASAELLNMSTHGVRLSGALRGNFDAIFFRAEIGETFGPGPASTDISLEASYKLPAAISSAIPLFVGVQYQFAYRDLSAETSRTEVTIGGTENLLALTVGANFNLLGGTSAPAPVAAPEPVQEAEEELPPAQDGSLDL